MKIRKASYDESTEESDENGGRFVGVMADLEARTADLEKLAQLIPFKRESAGHPVPIVAIRTVQVASGRTPRSQ